MFISSWLLLKWILTNFLKPPVVTEKLCSGWQLSRFVLIFGLAFLHPKTFQKLWCRIYFSGFLLFSKFTHFIFSRKSGNILEKETIWFFFQSFPFEIFGAGWRQIIFVCWSHLWKLMHMNESLVCMERPWVEYPLICLQQCLLHLIHCQRFQDSIV